MRVLNRYCTLTDAEYQTVWVILRITGFLNSELLGFRTQTNLVFGLRIAGFLDSKLLCFSTQNYCFF
jgi:hypothetical protein